MEIGALELRGPTFAGALKTGDRFLVDDDGYFFYCGRADDLFKVSGRWVAPAEVERALLLHPAVWECAVVEDRDDDGLPQPHAFVVANIGHAPSDELAHELMRFVKDEIAPYKYPRQVLVRRRAAACARRQGAALEAARRRRVSARRRATRRA